MSLIKKNLRGLKLDDKEMFDLTEKTHKLFTNGSATQLNKVLRKMTGKDDFRVVMIGDHYMADIYATH